MASFEVPYLISISGMAKQDSCFTILLNVNRTPSVDEMAQLSQANVEDL
ncbi:MAG: hypothetical protein WC782_11870 [Methylococcaceae bacterium]